MEYEITTIEHMGYVDYFLIVWDFIRFARSKNIEVGPGRGSGAGSICAYALAITEVDPIRYSLLFERFLNPDRISMPDIDIDFCYERRGEVIDYVIEKYGADHVAQIITFGTMAARAVIRDVGRALNMGYGEVDAIAKMVPNELNITLQKALEKSSELREKIAEDPAAARLMELARRGKADIFTIGPILGFLLAREAEAKAIRLIMVGKLNRLPQEKIRERLREMYV